MAERKSLSKKIRFEVFKRDGFTCQYCGRMAPDVVLEVDHIDPVANGGSDNIMNLVTSCFDCNRGKGKRKLTDKDEIIKQQEQLKELSVKREQLKMMLKWRNELSKFDEEQIDKVDDFFRNKTESSFTEHGREQTKKWIKEFGLIEILECTEISISQYYIRNDDDSKSKTFNYIPRIANVRAKQEKDPTIKGKNMLRALLRRKLNYFNETLYARMVKSLKEDDLMDLKDIAMDCRSWTDFVNTFNEVFGGDW